MNVEGLNNQNDGDDHRKLVAEVASAIKNLSETLEQLAHQMTRVYGGLAVVCAFYDELPPHITVAILRRVADSMAGILSSCATAARVYGAEMRRILKSDSWKEEGDNDGHKWN